METVFDYNITDDMKSDIRKLKGGDLANYILSDENPDRRLQEIASTLFDYCDKEKFFELLESIARRVTRNKTYDYEFTDVVLLLFNPLFCELGKALEVLEDVLKNDKDLIAVYPGLDEEPTEDVKYTRKNPTEDMEFICSILDGGLYVR